MYIMYIILYTLTAATARADLGISSLWTYTHARAAAPRTIYINKQVGAPRIRMSLYKRSGGAIFSNFPGRAAAAAAASLAIRASSACACKGICMRQIQNGRKNDKYTICNLKPTIILPRVGGARENRETYTRDVYNIYILCI